MRSGRGLLSLALLAVLSPYARASEWYTSRRVDDSHAVFALLHFLFRCFDDDAGMDEIVRPGRGRTLFRAEQVRRRHRHSCHRRHEGIALRFGHRDGAPFSEIDRSGLRLRIGGVVGNYGYTNTCRRTDHRHDAGRLGVDRLRMDDGEGVVRDLWRIDFSNNQLNKYDANNGSVGQATGKIALDFSYRPTATMMLSGVASYSSAHSAYYARLKAGWAIAPSTYVGPEVIFMGDAFFQQWRVGAISPAPPSAPCSSAPRPA